MQIRPATPADLPRLRDIDSTIESTRYLHLNRTGEALSRGWHLEERPLREKLIASNPLDDDTAFVMKQIVTGADEGLALVAEHDDALVACLIAQPHPPTGTLRLLDLRVDYDRRREGLGLALLFQCIQGARQRSLRAVTTRTLTNNFPAAQLLNKAGFDLAGLDVQFHSNHDLVKEAIALFWYAALD